MDKENKSLQAYVAKKLLNRLKAFGKKANENDGKNIFGSKPAGKSIILSFF